MKFLQSGLGIAVIPAGLFGNKYSVKSELKTLFICLIVLALQGFSSIAKAVDSPNGEVGQGIYQQGVTHQGYVEQGAEVQGTEVQGLSNALQNGLIDGLSNGVELGEDCSFKNITECTQFCQRSSGTQVDQYSPNPCLCTCAPKPYCVFPDLSACTAHCKSSSLLVKSFSLEACTCACMPPAK